MRVFLAHIIAPIVVTSLLVLPPLRDYSGVNSVIASGAGYMLFSFFFGSDVISPYFAGLLFYFILYSILGFLFVFVVHRRLRQLGMLTFGKFIRGYINVGGLLSGVVILFAVLNYLHGTLPEKGLYWLMFVPVIYSMVVGATFWLIARPDLANKTV